MQRALTPGLPLLDQLAPLLLLFAVVVEAILGVDAFPLLSFIILFAVLDVVGFPLTFSVLVLAFPVLRILEEGVPSGSRWFHCLAKLCTRSIQKTMATLWVTTANKNRRPLIPKIMATITMDNRGAPSRRLQGGVIPPDAARYRRPSPRGFRLAPVRAAPGATGLAARWSRRLSVG